MLAEFLADLRRLGIELWAENGELHYRAPVNTLTQDLRAELAQRKPALLALFERKRSSLVVEDTPLPLLTPDVGKRDEPFPLTDIQHAYWIGRSGAFELGNVATHAYFEFEREGLDVERLGGAWERLIERHEMLRAVVGADGRQQILSVVPRYAIETLDLRGASAEEAQRQLRALRERLAHRVYDPSGWPLFAVCVTRLAGERVRVHVSIDLLIADVWSLFILFREWGLLYAEPQRPLAPLKLSFRDYVLAEAALQETPRYARARGYWTQRLKELRPGPELPLARMPAAVAQPRFERRRARLAEPRWSRVKAGARQAGLTPSVVLCTVFTEVLAVWSKSAQFTLNVTLFHRLPLHPEVNAVVGDFTSTVLLAVEGEAAGSFIERAQRLQRQLWEDLEHRYVSGVQVLRDLARLAGGGPRMGMPVVFTSTLGQEDTDAVAEWLGELVYGVSQTPQVWLDHQVGEERGALVFNWDAVEALFPAGLLDAMFAAYCTRLEQLADSEPLWHAPTPLLLPPSQRQLLDSLNHTAAAGGAPAATLCKDEAVVPRDELERRLAALFEEILGVAPSGVHDHFFDLGGDSFLAVRLMIRVQQLFGRTIPVTALFAADTIDGLARAIRDDRSHPASPLVQLSSGDGAPFFCIHPIGGHVLCYVDLARSLGAARPFYGIQAAGLQGEATPLADVAAMAAHYLGAIRQVQPRGPYLLGGWSMGGTVAFEMALQLRARGEEVARLVLIDTETTAVARTAGRAARDADLANEIPRDMDAAQLSHLLSVITNNNRALKAYRERRYSGAMTLLRASEQPPHRSHDLGWNPLVAGGVDVAIVPGDHYTILQKPNLAVLAGQLRRSLDTQEARMDRTSRSSSSAGGEAC